MSLERYKPSERIQQIASIYPYEVGQTGHGIPFEIIVQKRNSPNVREIMSGSDHLLWYVKDKDTVRVFDPAREEFDLLAYTSGNQLEFSVYTRMFDPKNHSLSGHHPDLFAKPFVDVSMRYFPRVHSIKEIWFPHSYSYYLYETARNKGLSEIDAIHQTVSAPKYAEYEFIFDANHGITMIPTYYGDSYLLFFRKT
jgi:hypothetical protein